jgi:hypothetical protein
LYLCRKQEVSSIYKPNKPYLSRFFNAGRFDVVAEHELETSTVDSVLAGGAPVDFIKADAQGYELPILKAAKETLKNVIGVEVEVEFTPMYEDQPLFSDVDAFMRANGFELFDLKRCFWKRKDAIQGPSKGQLMFADALYFRSPEALLEKAGIDSGVVSKAVALYLLYGYLDLASALVALAAEKGILDSQENRFMRKIIKRKRFWFYVPNFKGKSHVYEICRLVIGCLSPGGFYAGTDRKLGN